MRHITIANKHDWLIILRSRLFLISFPLAAVWYAFDKTTNAMHSVHAKMLSAFDGHGAGSLLLFDFFVKDILTIFEC